MLKRKKKPILTRIIACVFAVAFTLPVFARDFTYTYEGQTLTYTVIDEDAKTCSTKQGSYSTPGNIVSGDLIIPEIAKDGNMEYTITSIGRSAFYGCSDLKSVEIPNSVTSIGRSAFGGCSGLTSVEIPNSVTSIGSSAFRDCGRLKSVEIPNSVTSIGEYAFSYCCSLTELTIGNSVTTIGDNAFLHCCSLTELTIPNSVTSISEYAFGGCSGLTSVEIPNSVTSISEYAFCSCSSLTELTIPNSVSSIGNKAFDECTALTKIVVKGVEPAKISSSSFSPSTYRNCIVYVPNEYCLQKYRYEWYEFEFIMLLGETKEYTISTPGDLISLIDINEVNNITGLILKGDINGTDILTINKMPNIQTLDLSETNIVSGGMPYYEKDNEKWDTQDDTLDAFWSYNLQNLENLKLPNTLKTIGSDALSEKKYLRYIYIPSSVTSIGDKAFYHCRRIAQLTIPNSVTSIGEEAFNMCYQLESVILPTKLEKLSLGIFANCESLKTFTLHDPIQIIEKMAFANCESLEQITLPGSLREISENAFYACSELTKVTVLNPIPPVIESNTFPDNISAATLNVPEGSLNWYWIHPYWGKFGKINNGLNSGTTIDLFEDNIAYHITSASDATVEVISANITVSREEGVSVVIPRNIMIDGQEYRVVGIANEGFKNNPIISIELPSTIGYVGINAFAGCASLKEIVCKASMPPSVDKLSFDFNTYNIATLYVTEGSENDYRNNSIWGLFKEIKTGNWSGITEVNDDYFSSEIDYLLPYQVYNLQGTYVSESKENLFPGIYIIRQNRIIKKLIIQ